MNRLQRLRGEWLLLLFATLAALLALLDPQPLAHYRRWLQVPTLAGLAGLLVAIQGIRDSGLVQRVAGALVARAHSLRGLGLRLMLLSAVLSMALTNDASLFLVVPLTLALGAISNLPVLRMVVLEALAVNAGSALSPIGNPQNLLLWQHSGLSFARFVLTMAPAVAVMGALAIALTWWWLPRERIALAADPVGDRRVATPLAAASLLALVGMVVLMEYGGALVGVVLLVLLFAGWARPVLARTDWLLLLTFAAIFVGLGHLAELPQVSAALARLDLGRPLTLYLAGIAGSQLISNVPATVLLLERVPPSQLMTLAVAVNVGGFGLAIGSLANLIALRLAAQPQGLRRLHQVSIPFLLLCAPLAYAVWRWLG